MNPPRPCLNPIRPFFLAVFATLLGKWLRTAPTSDPPGILNDQGRIAVSGQNHDGVGYFKFSLLKDFEFQK